jgi:pimeloyl-ACP methyl ester carboxylesterase
MTLAAVLFAATATDALAASAADPHPLPVATDASPLAVALAAAATVSHAFVVEVDVGSPSLGHNTIGAPARARVAVHATGGWTACRRKAAKCAVVLYLPGFDGSPRTAYLGPPFDLRRALDAAVAARKLPPLIVVVPDPRNALGGSFYTDSPTTGAWATFLLDELLPGVASSLGVAEAIPYVVAGHSMGGFGALHLALTRPERWRGVVAISPVAGVGFAEGARYRAAVTGLRRDPQRAASLLANPTSQAFSERLFWAMAAAWTSKPLAATWQQAIVVQPSPRLDPAFAANWRRLDPAQRFATSSGPDPCRVGRWVASVGRRDGIIASRDVAAVVQAASRRCPRRVAVRFTAHDGNHGNHVLRDAVSGLIAVLRP